MKNEKDSSILIVLLSIFLILVLLDKSTKNGNALSQNTREMKNYSDMEIPAPPFAPQTSVAPPAASNEFEEIPQLEEIPEISEPFSETTNEGYSVYFIKFYGKGNKSHSRLVKVQRTNSDYADITIETILDALIAGPNQEEKANGILSALPPGLNFSHSYRIENNILHLSLSQNLEYGAGPEILKDRLDQITFSLMELEEIKGIKLYIDGKKITAIGGDGIPVPDILTKNQRMVMRL